MTDFTRERSVTIQAPIEVVYDYVSDFPRHVDMMQHLDLVPPPHAGG